MTMLELKSLTSSLFEVKSYFEDISFEKFTVYNKQTKKRLLLAKTAVSAFSAKKISLAYKFSKQAPVRIFS